MYSYPEVYGRLNFETAAIVFLKKDGTVREAKGTTKTELIPETQLSSKTSRTYTPNPNVVKYFDIEKEGWRSFNEENFIGFE